MRCTLCGTDARRLILLPITQPNGALQIFTCFPSAEKSTAYCKKHKIAHIGFVDKTTACKYCIDELVGMEEKQAHAIATQILSNLIDPEELYEHAEMACAIAGGTAEIAILRFVVTKALRTARSIQDIVTEVIHKKSAEILLHS